MVTVTPCQSVISMFSKATTRWSRNDAVHQIMLYCLNTFYLERLFLCNFCGSLQRLSLEIVKNWEHRS